jgi:hypothetical protein
MQHLQQIARSGAKAFAAAQLGKNLPVIFERENAGVLKGWSDHYLAVTAPAGSFPCGKIVNLIANEKNLAESLQSTVCGSIL